VADRTIKVITPATESDLLTLDEAKQWLNIPLTDTSQDAMLEMMISTFSSEIAQRLNRHPTVTLGKEEVSEVWRETMNGRLFLSHWPVKETDIVSVTVGDVAIAPMRRLNGALVPMRLNTRDAILATGDYELEEASGKLSNISVGGSQSAPWNHPVTVHYSGGYSLPDEAPLELKHAVVMLIREEKIRMLQMQTAGIRQISHKEARVSFFDPNALLIRSVSMKSPTIQAIESILTHFMRFEV
jgi:hypothetical protein